MKKIGVNGFSEFNYLSQLKVSKKGKIAFIKSNAVVKDNKYISDLYLLDENNNAKKMTSSGDVSNFIWLDDNTLIFPAVRKEKDKKEKKKNIPLTVFQKLLINGGEAEEFLRFNMEVTSLYPICENKYLFIAKYNKEHENLMKCEDKEKRTEKINEEKDYIVLDEIPFWSNGAGITNKIRNRLYIYDNGEITPLTNEYTNVGNFELYDNYAVFTGREFKDKMETKENLYYIPFDTLKIENITHEDTYYYNCIVPISESELITYGTNGKKHGINEDGEFLLYNFKTKKIETLGNVGEYSVGNRMNSDVKYKSADNKFLYDGKGFYFTATLNDNVKIMYLNIDNRELKEITKEKCVINEIAFVNESIYFIGMRGMLGSEIHRLSSNNSIETLTSFNKNAQEYEISEPQEFTFANKDGVKIYGWVIKPIGFEEGKKYPTILEVHGGPKTTYGPNYIHEIQYLASEGYAVIYCNPTGSAGRGNEFADLRRKYGTIDYDDLMMFADECIKAFNWIDEERMGVTGGSYGGFMTNWIIGHTSRFKAAVSQRSISNWISKSNTTDIGYYFNKDQIGETAWTDYEELWDKSPLKYADKASTPTLFIHSEEDYRCWLVEGLQMFTALKFFGVESRMVRFKGENHELSRSGLPKHRIRRLKEMKDWFDKYLK